VLNEEAQVLRRLVKIRFALKKRNKDRMTQGTGFNGFNVFVFQNYKLSYNRVDCRNPIVY
jgi:hypothetical protein